MEKEIKINVPNGYEIDKENSTFECIKFKPIKKELPKTWEEYCKANPRRKGESWINDDSLIESISTSAGDDRYWDSDKNLLPNREYAEAMLALCQLIQLRDCYNDGWEPNWRDVKYKYSIVSAVNIISNDKDTSISHVLSFKTKELRDTFMNNFHDLIEVAKPLL